MAGGAGRPGRSGRDWRRGTRREQPAKRRNRPRGGANRGAPPRRSAHRVRPPTRNHRRLVGAAPVAAAEVLPHHRDHGPLARQHTTRTRRRRGGADRGAPSQRRPRRVRPPTTRHRRLVGAAPVAAAEVLPDHCGRGPLARQHAARPVQRARRDGAAATDRHPVR